MHVPDESRKGQVTREILQEAFPLRETHDLMKKVMTSLSAASGEASEARELQEHSRLHARLLWRLWEIARRRTRGIDIRTLTEIAPAVGAGTLVAALFLWITPLGIIKTATLLALSLASVVPFKPWKRREKSPRLTSDLVEHPPGTLKDVLFRNAVRACQAGDYSGAAQNLQILQERGHVPSGYVLALLFALTDSQECHEDALALFDEALQHWSPVPARAGLASALLRFELTGDQDDVRHALAVVAQQTNDSSLGERLASSMAASLLGIDGPSSATEEERVLASLAESCESLRGSVLLGVRPDPTTVRRVIGGSVSVCLDEQEDALMLLLPLELDAEPPKHWWSGFAKAASADVPVLRAGYVLGDSAYSIPLVSRVARWCTSHRLRGNSLGFASLAVVFVAAEQLMFGNLLVAGIALACSAIIDAFDGQVAQTSSKRADRSLFLDYLFDRVGDIALGVGFFALFADQLSVPFMALAFGFTIASLLLSYVRAEADRFKLEASGGVFERVHRMTLLVVGLIFSYPAYALLATTILTVVSILQRIRRAWLSASASSPVRENEFRLRPATLARRASPARSLKAL